MDNLLFLDKIGFNLHIAASYRYSLDEARTYYIFSANKGSNVFLLTIISNSGILHYKIVYGSFISKLFVEFLEESQKNRILNKNQILVIDNARTYNTQEDTDFFYNNLLYCQYFSTYTPQPNSN